MLKQWNSKARPWLKIKLSEQAVKKNTILVKSIGATYSNLQSAVDCGNASRSELEFFDKCWGVWKKKISRKGHQIRPSRFGELSAPVGKVIHTCSQAAVKASHYLIIPGIEKKGETILSPISVTVHPAGKFPKKHPHGKFDSHWQGVLGELSLLLVHMRIQRAVMCGMESIDKAKLIPVRKQRDAIIAEIKRRRDTLRKSLHKKTSLYQLATNYWRVEECFSAIFHDDERPLGSSYFDLLRKRVREWHPIIAKKNKIIIRNFLPGKDTLAAINKEINSMVLRRKPGAVPGSILRQLRPAITVRENNTTRTLPGRVICT